MKNTKTLLLMGISILFASLTTYAVNSDPNIPMLCGYYNAQNGNIDTWIVSNHTHYHFAAPEYKIDTDPGKDLTKALELCGSNPSNHSHPANFIAYHWGADWIEHNSKKHESKWALFAYGTDCVTSNKDAKTMQACKSVKNELQSEIWQ